MSRRDASGRYSAAAGLYALQNNVARLKEDHDNAAWMRSSCAPLAPR
ncbi:hypothetical protein [Klebsiella michiganensis]